MLQIAPRGRKPPPAMTELQSSQIHLDADFSYSDVKQSLMHRLAICQPDTAGFQLLPVFSVTRTATAIFVRGHDNLPEFPSVIRHLIILRIEIVIRIMRSS